jgi:hypothetical protein
LLFLHCLIQFLPPNTEPLLFLPSVLSPHSITFLITYPPITYS